MRFNYLILSCSILSFLSSFLVGGEVSGTVTDSSGGVLVGAQVRLLHVSSGIEVEDVTDATGRYSFSDRDPGTYRIAVGMEGFSEDSRSLVVQERGEPYRADFTLSIGTLHSQVSVAAARGKRDMLSVPFVTQQLDETLLERGNPVSTGDAMVAAVGVTSVGSGPFQVRPRLRGLDSSRVLILVDGERLNNARVATERAGIEPGLIDPSTVESIEVVSGAGTSLYGSDALSGAINIVTRRPTPTPKLRFQGGLDGFFSSNESGRRGTATVGLSGQRFAFKLVGSLERFGNYESGSPAREESLHLHEAGVLVQQDTADALGFDFGAFPDPFNAPFVRSGREIPNSQAHGSNLNFSGLGILAENQTLSARYIRRRTANVGFPDFEAPLFFQNISLPYSNLEKVSARYEVQQLSEWFASLSVSLYHQKSERLLRNDFPVQFPSPDRDRFFPVGIMRLQILSDTEQNVDSTGVDVQGTFMLAPSNVLTVGMTAYQDSSRDARHTVSQLSLLGTVDLGQRGPQPNVFESPFPLGPPSVASPVRVPESDLRDIGVFFQDEWEVNRWLRLSGSFRIDGYRVQSQDTPGYEIDSLIEGADPAVSPDALPAVEGETISRTAYTGDIGVVLRPTQHVSLIAHYARSYRHPNLEELLFAGPATVGSLVPNTLVEPETGDNLDFGFRVRTGKVSGSLTYFHNDYDGFISPEIVSMTPAGPLFQAINFSKVRIQGVEGFLEAPLRLRRLLVTPWGNFAYQRGEIVEGSNPLTGDTLDSTPQDNITPVKAVTGLRMTDGKQRYWVDYSNRIQTRVKRVATTLLDSPFLIAQDLFSLNGFTVHRLGWGVNWNRETYRWGLSFALENMGDKYHREQFQFAPARGRSLTVGLHLHTF